MESECKVCNVLEEFVILDEEQGASCITVIEYDMGIGTKVELDCKSCGRLKIYPSPIRILSGSTKGSTVGKGEKDIA